MSTGDLLSYRGNRSAFAEERLSVDQNGVHAVPLRDLTGPRLKSYGIVSGGMKSCQ